MLLQRILLRCFITYCTPCQAPAQRQVNGIPGPAETPVTAVRATGRAGGTNPPPVEWCREGEKKHSKGTRASRTTNALRPLTLRQAQGERLGGSTGSGQALSLSSPQASLRPSREEGNLGKGRAPRGCRGALLSSLSSLAMAPDSYAGRLVLTIRTTTTIASIAPITITTQTHAGVPGCASGPVVNTPVELQSLHSPSSVHPLTRQ
jgi:hypothetical protein